MARQTTNDATPEHGSDATYQGSGGNVALPAPASAPIPAPSNPLSALRTVWVIEADGSAFRASKALVEARHIVREDSSSRLPLLVAVEWVRRSVLKLGARKIRGEVQ